jgi:hypothetical protein
MESNGGKSEPADPEKVLRMLELELMQQRAMRQRAGTPYRGLRAVGFIFLFAVILAALLAFYYLFSSGRLDELRARSAPKPTPGTTALSRTP